MTDAGLMLSEPARTLWRTTRDSVRQGLDAIGDRIEYRLGGGTILAARWGHRISFDVDIDLDEGVELERLEHADHGWFQQQVRKLGAIPEYSPRLNLYDIRFGERPHEQEVQLWSHQLAIARGHAVEDREELVLSNAQILRGKLQRAAHKLARDVYDIRKASEADPRSLEIAVNTIPHERLDTLALDWIVGYGRIGSNAHERLRGIPEGEEKNHYALGKAGAGGILRATYERLLIGVAAHRIVVEAVTRGKDRRRMTMTADEAEEKFEAWGINGHLRQKGPGAQAIREYAALLCRKQAGDVLVFEEENDRATHWRTATRSQNLPLIVATRPHLATGRAGWWPTPSSICRGCVRS